ncbi:MAG: transposase [Elusimicrobia bacterium]|nr:transposase [Candidatus Liberimonas magnetica]
MPRQGRINIEGGIYHVIQRGIERREIFKDDADREEFLRRLAEGLENTRHKCYGWVLMPNHFHLLIRTGAKPLSDLMRKLLTGYALYFNRKYKRSGYLYQNRYKSILCQEESYFLELVRYIHLNPLRARLVKDIKELNKYKWCGHSVLAGKNKIEWQSVGEILERFGAGRGEAQRKYVEFVRDAKDMGKKEELTGGGLIRSAGGWREVIGLRKSKERWQGDERILGDGEFVSKILKEAEEKIQKTERLKREGWDLSKVMEKVAEQLDIEKSEMKKKRRDIKVSDARKIVLYIGNKELKISGRELGEYFHVSRQAITRAVNAGERLVAKYNIKLM